MAQNSSESQGSVPAQPPVTDNQLLQGVFFDAQARTAYKKYCETAFSIDSWTFLNRVQELNDVRDREKYVDELRSIYEDCISPNGKYQININGMQSKALDSAMKNVLNNPDNGAAIAEFSHAYKAAVAEIFDMLASGDFKIFKHAQPAEIERIRTEVLPIILPSMKDGLQVPLPPVRQRNDAVDVGRGRADANADAQNRPAPDNPDDNPFANADAGAAAADDAAAMGGGGGSGNQGDAGAGVVGHEAGAHRSGAGGDEAAGHDEPSHGVEAPPEAKAPKDLPPREV